jgi:glycosyltransferase involved in cell wall biosynthesis
MNSEAYPDQHAYKQMPANLVVFSHLRWDFVYQRPQHLLTRLAKQANVFFIEEPIFDAQDKVFYSISKKADHVIVAVPHLVPGLPHENTIDSLQLLLNEYLSEKTLSDVAFWYYTPMALEYSRHYNAQLTVFDCMDELSAFKFAPDSLKILERELLEKADIVFTGGQSLFEAKKDQHKNIYAFPSSIEKDHFSKARLMSSSPDDQIDTLKPKLGFYGVIDERFDIDLIKGIADAKPDWQIILIGPVVKIDPAILPKNSNIHYLGSKKYDELPLYMATWNIALIPFLLNESTKFISPTKTPEYLAAGLPVVSTPITDVVNPYGVEKLVSIAKDAEGFVSAIEDALSTSPANKSAWLAKVDLFLTHNSWDLTSHKMLKLMAETNRKKLLTITDQYV